MERADKRGRLFILLLIFIILFSILFYRLWELQIVSGEKYAKDYELKVTKTVRDHNTRGMIYDCNGEALAYNELVYTIIMTDDGVYSSEREHQLALNSMIYHVTKKLEEQQEPINNELKIRTRPDGTYEYTVSDTALLRFKADIFGKANPKDLTSEQTKMTADEMVEYLSSNQKFALYGQGDKGYSQKERKEYGLPGEYSSQEVLTIIGIKYMLSLNSYRKYIPIVLAKDISEQTVAYLFENQPSFPGIEVQKDWKRVYAGGEAFSHILGYTGTISTEELEQYQGTDRNYTFDSVVGKAGIEQYLEEHLQGIDGEGKIIVNNVGKIVGEKEVIRETVSGQDVTLSIDKNLQIALYHILEQNLAGVVASNLIHAKEFDKTQIADTSNIRIPIYDVYQALIENHVISLEDLHNPNATEWEQNLAQLLERKQSEAMEAIKAELLHGSISYDLLPEELQEYVSYLVGGGAILDEDAIDKEDETYKKWVQKSEISPKEFLTYAVEQEWIAAGILDTEQGYFTAGERYTLLVDVMINRMEKETEFKELFFKRLILEDKITGKDLCMLLYEQQVLSKADEDYEKIRTGEWDAFTFLKKKIEHLELTPAQLALDPCSASAVVVQPQTGKVLAMVSYPGYDNNRLANEMDSDYYNQLLKDRSLPLYNRATQQLTAPGSTFKPITIIAGLQEGVIFPDTSVLCDGVFDKVVPSLRCWKHSGHGTVTDVPTALQFSCNDYLCEIAYRMGTQTGTEYTDSASLKRLQAYCELFCLNEKSGIEIAESSPHVTDAYGIPSAIGQGTHNYATVQLARYVSTIASKGDVFSLSLIKGESDLDGNFTEKEAKRKHKVELPDTVWEVVHSGMIQFAQNNNLLKEMEIPVAGKTGTAQEAENRPDHALFVGYAPADKPEIAVAVRIANGYGSSNATAVGKNIFNYYFGLESLENIVTGEASQAFNTRTD